VIAKAYDLDMKEYTIEGEGLLARCICHELDHLDGHMYVELAGDTIHDTNYDVEE
jgi:peptide deformylase